MERSNTKLGSPFILVTCVTPLPNAPIETYTPKPTTKALSTVVVTVTASGVPVVCDAAPSKQGKYLPGSHIPICSPETIENIKPDWIIILPWNIADEVKQQLNFIQSWTGQFVVAIPEVRIL